MYLVRSSRKLPLKLPAEHEPVRPTYQVPSSLFAPSSMNHSCVRFIFTQVLPASVDIVVAVAGVDVVGCPLDESHVCRANIVSQKCVRLLQIAHLWRTA